MNQDEVVALMKSSKSEEEWNANTDKVKAACNGKKFTVNGYSPRMYGGLRMVETRPLRDQRD